MSALGALFKRELALAWGKGGGALYACAFYAGVATLLPLASGPAPEKLGAVAPGAAFVALALSSLLSLERLFERDFEDGGLDLLALGSPPLELIAAIKCLAQWLAAGAPLALLSPVIAVALGAPPVIFGAGAVDALNSGLDWTGGLFLLLAYCLCAVALAPFAMAAGVRNAIS